MDGIAAGPGSRDSAARGPRLPLEARRRRRQRGSACNLRTHRGFHAPPTATAGLASVAPLRFADKSAGSAPDGGMGVGRWNLLRRPGAWRDGRSRRGLPASPGPGPSAYVPAPDARLLAPSAARVEERRSTRTCGRAATRRLAGARDSANLFAAGEADVRLEWRMTGSGDGFGEARLRKPSVPPPGYTRNTVVTEWLVLNCAGDWASRSEQGSLQVRFREVGDMLRALEQFGGGEIRRRPPAGPRSV